MKSSAPFSTGGEGAEGRGVVEAQQAAHQVRLGDAQALLLEVERVPARRGEPGPRERVGEHLPVVRHRGAVHGRHQQLPPAGVLGAVGGDDRVEHA
ncbi:hypothetical protein [Dactylosporangium maewongense]|uniref:hypothetical protein n=1 Tax=Dactylosporangium maewongense TaxID=634393 RepID=UPI0031D49D06